MSVLKNLEYQIEMCKNDIHSLKNKLQELENKKQKFLSLTHICPSCNGTGQERYTDAAGSGDWRDCKTCNGIGKVEKIKTENENIKSERGKNMRLEKFCFMLQTENQELKRKISELEKQTYLKIKN